MASTLCQKQLTPFVKKLKILSSLDHPIMFKFASLWHKHLLRNYKCHFRLLMSEFAAAIWNTLSKHQLFTLNFAFKLFHVSIAMITAEVKNTICNSLITMFPQAGKIWSKSDDPNYTKFWASLQKAVSRVKHFEISLAPFWKRFLQLKQFHDAKVFNTRLQSFVIPKITIVWHMKPE